MSNNNDFTIQVLFDKSQKLIVADNANARVVRRQEDGQTYYDKEYIDYNNNMSARREVMLSASLRNLYHVWHADTDNVSDLRQYLRTEDAGLNLADWMEIIPFDYDVNPSFYQLSLEGVLQETTQFVRLLHQCLEALHEIHSREVIHLDIKVDNICVPFSKQNGKYILEFNELKLIDFDMAISKDLPLIKSININIFDHTNLYQAPRLKDAIKQRDIEAQNNLDFGVDLFALGTMLDKILKNYNNVLIPTISLSEASNLRIITEIQSIIERLLSFEHSIERTLDTHQSLLKKTSNILKRLGLNKTKNSFKFSINLSQIYDWDPRVTRYAETSVTDVSQNIKTSDSAEQQAPFLFEVTDPEELMQDNKLNRQSLKDKSTTDLYKDNVTSGKSTPEPNPSLKNSKYEGMKKDSDSLTEAVATTSKHQPLHLIDKQDPFGLKKGSDNDEPKLINNSKKILYFLLLLIVVLVGGFLFWHKILPATVDPIPEPLEPTPEPVQHTPEPVQPTPEPVQPTPEPVQPTPEPVQPTPEPVQPTPEPVQPTPEPVQPTPEPVKPTPQLVKPTPEQPSRDITLEDILGGEIIEAPVVRSDSQDTDNSDQDVTLEDIMSSLE